MGYGTNFDSRKSARFNRNSITVVMGGLGRTIYFKKGGEIEIPDEVIAYASGGASIQNNYDATDVEGEVTVEFELIQFFIDLFTKHNTAIGTSAVYETYDMVSQSYYKLTYGNVRVKKMPKISVADSGAEGVMTISFSLNDLVSAEVVEDK